MAPLLFIATLLLAGTGMVVAAVWLLAGFPWAMLLAGVFTLSAAVLIRRGMIANG